jgi:hypothetical protein
MSCALSVFYVLHHPTVAIFFSCCIYCLSFLAEVNFLASLLCLLCCSATEYWTLYHLYVCNLCFLSLICLLVHVLPIPISPSLLQPVMSLVCIFNQSYFIPNSRLPSFFHPLTPAYSSSFPSFHQKEAQTIHYSQLPVLFLSKKRIP